MERLISKEQLLKFAQAVYTAGCHGYMDLLENFCDRAVDDLFLELKQQPSVPAQMVATSGTASPPPPYPSISLSALGLDPLNLSAQFSTNNEMIRTVTLTNTTTETSEG